MLSQPAGPVAHRRGDWPLGEQGPGSVSSSLAGVLGSTVPCLHAHCGSSQMTSAWKTVACGGTKDQLFMQEKARQLLGRLKPSHTSRTLILS